MKFICCLFFFYRFCFSLAFHLFHVNFPLKYPLFEWKMIVFCLEHPLLLCFQFDSNLSIKKISPLFEDEVIAVQSFSIFQWNWNSLWHLSAISCSLWLFLRHGINSLFAVCHSAVQTLAEILRKCNLFAIAYSFFCFFVFVFLEIEYSGRSGNWIVTVNVITRRWDFKTWIFIIFNNVCTFYLRTFSKNTCP